MVLLESGENYLETILILQQRNGNVRSIDIATEMNFSKPSVSRAMSILKKSGYIIMEPDGRIVLTENGLKKAASVLDRHKTLTVFLTDILNVPPDTAEKDACRIEHPAFCKLYHERQQLVQQLGTVAAVLCYARFEYRQGR